MRSRAATRPKTRRSRPISRCSTGSAASAACWCSRAPMAATMRRCSTRSRASRDACAASPSAARSCRAQTLNAWHKLGVRGLRANEFRRDGKPYYQNGVRLSDIEPLYPAMAELGWHLQLWIDTRDLPELQPGARARAGVDAGRGRSHGPHGSPARHRSSRFPGAGARRGRRQAMVQGVGRLPARVAPRPIISRQSPSTTRWSPPIRPISSGARTGRIRGRRDRCRTPGICWICSWIGRRASGSAGDPQRQSGEALRFSVNPLIPPPQAEEG